MAKEKLTIKVKDRQVKRLDYDAFVKDLTNEEAKFHHNPPVSVGTTDIKLTGCEVTYADFPTKVSGKAVTLGPSREDLLTIIHAHGFEEA